MSLDGTARAGTVHASHVWKRFRADPGRRQLRELSSRLRSRRGWRWALRDVDMSAEPGESFGVVGRNGSGKTTLLKLLSGNMFPYAGTIDVRGRIGALVDLGSGFHPELSGRENIALLGAVLGLSRRDVAKRFDAIVDFAELQTAIDRPVKYYSSGMRMRIGFAIPAFMSADVLLVDEVLAVGDAGFQQKCLNRMREVTAEGTTVVFVSHDLATVEATCANGLWLDSGVVAARGDIRTVLGAYRQSIEERAEVHESPGGAVKVLKVSVNGPGGGDPLSHEKATITLVLAAETSVRTELSLGISDGPPSPIFSLTQGIQLQEGDTVATCTISDLPLPGGRFYLWLGLDPDETDRSPMLRWASLAWQPVAHFDVVGPPLDPAPRAVARLAPVHVDTRWDVSAD